MLEIALHGAMLYLVLFVLLGLTLRRPAGEINTLDLVFVAADSAADAAAPSPDDHSAGAVLPRTMRREYLTLNELQAQLRAQGIGEIAGPAILYRVR